MGPTDFKTKDVYLRTAISVDARRLGALRLREDARLPLGHLPRAEPRRTARSASATTSASPPGSEVPGEYRNWLRRIIVTQADTEPAWSSSSACSATPRPRSTTCATCSRSTSRRAATCGRWSTCCTRYFGRDGREEAEELLAAPLGQPRQPAHPRHVQRAVRGLALVLLLHDVHRPRRQVPAARARRVGLRSAGAHVPLHADRGGAPHVRRRDRRRRA